MDYAEKRKNPRLKTNNFISYFYLDENRNLYTNIGADSRRENPLHQGSQSSVAPSTPTVISTYVAPSAKKIYKVSVSGTGTADFTLRLNLAGIEVRRTHVGLNELFIFEKGLPLAQNDTLDVQVNSHATSNKDFDMSIFGE